MRPRVMFAGIPTRQVAPFDGSIDVTILDLVYLDADDIKPAASLAVGASEAVDQATFAAKFAGLAGDTRTDLDTNALTDFPVMTDVTVAVDCESSTFANGDMVAAVRNGGGTALENAKVKKTTNPDHAIGYVVGNYASAVTRVNVRFVSRVWPHAVTAAASIDAQPVAVAAAGSAQGDAAALTAEVLNVVSAADGTKGVVLPAGSTGRKVRVYNSVATNGLKVYPPSSGTINGGSANAAITIEGKTGAFLECVDGTNWVAMFTADS